MTKKEKKGDESGVSLKMVSHDLYSSCHNGNGQEAKNKKIRRIPINKSLRELFIKLNLTMNGSRYIF